MSLSVFYAVRFSPAPELGEWLNIAVVGEGITERNAGIAVTESLERIEAAFGQDAVERVKHLCADLSELVGEMLQAQKRGEETQPIPSALKDMALSIAFSDKIMVFEGRFEEALAMIAKKYLSSPEEIDQLHSQQTAAAQSQDWVSAVQRTVRAIIAPEPAKTAVTESAPEGSGTSRSTVLIVGDSDELGSALIEELLARGATVRFVDSLVGDGKIVEIVSGDSKAGAGIKEIAARTGFDVQAVSHALLGGVANLAMNKATIDQIKSVAGKIEAQFSQKQRHAKGHDVIPSDLDGIDAVVYIGDAHVDDGSAEIRSARLSIVREAKANGAKKLVLASTYRVYGKSIAPVHEGSPLKPNTQAGKFTAELEGELINIAGENIGLTILRFGDLYGHAKQGAQPHKEGGHPQTVNSVASRAVFDKKVTVMDTAPIPFLHVEDAAASIVAVLAAPEGAVSGQIFNVGSASQHRTFGEVANRVQEQVPDAEVIVAAADIDSGACFMVFSKFSDSLGFTAKRTLEEGIDGVVNALRAAKSSMPPPIPPAGGSEVEQPELIDWSRLAKDSKTVEENQSASDQVRKKRS